MPHSYYLSVLLPCCLAGLLLLAAAVLLVSFRSEGETLERTKPMSAWTTSLVTKPTVKLTAASVKVLVMPPCVRTNQTAIASSGDRKNNDRSFSVSKKGSSFFDVSGGLAAPEADVILFNSRSSVAV